MNKFNRYNTNTLLTILFVCLVFLSFNTKNFTIQAKSNKTNELSSEIVMEVKSKRVLYKKDIKTKRPMASTTKILTAITIIENCNIDNICKINKSSVGIEGSSIYLLENEEIKVKDLLYGLMLRSGNDSADALAKYCCNSVEKFAKLMNETAKKIGAKDSNFINPHGLHNDNHYTTAYDLALISCYAMQNKTFKEIVSTKQITIESSVGKKTFVNKNRMLNEYNGSNGIKTGYTIKAGRCLVSSAIKNNTELVCVVLNCQPMFEKSKELLDNCFNEYKTFLILKKDDLSILTINNKHNKLYLQNDIFLPLKKKELNNIKIRTCFFKNVNNTKNVGVIRFYVKNQLIFSENIYTI